VNNLIPSGVENWIPNDPVGPNDYLQNVTATNTGIVKNDGLAGDVIVGYFEPLDGSLTNAGHEDDSYFMIVNGLSDILGTAVETIQQIRLDFDFGASGIDSLLRLSRDTGNVELVSLMFDGGSLYHLDLNLEGGTGDLFKYNNGGTFVGFLGDGDFDTDGDVDGADFLLWQRGGSPTPLSGSDLALWQANYGTGTLLAATSAAAVPEPASASLLILSALVLVGRRRRKECQ
jgi:hypothetical protein